MAKISSSAAAQIQQVDLGGGENVARTGGSTTGFRCPICGNIYEKVRSRDRHIPYCRRRANAPPPLPRQLSCSSCITAKVRCDRRRPYCSTCEVKKRKCLYKISQPAKPLSSISTRESDQASLDHGPHLDLSPGSNNSSLNSATPHIVLPEAIPPWEMSTRHLEAESAAQSQVMLTSTLPAFDPFNGFPVDNLWAGPLYNNSPRICDIRPPALGFDPDYSMFPMSVMTLPEKDQMMPVPPCPTTTTMPWKHPQSRALTTKEPPTGSTEINGQFMLRVLRTYPKMMLRKNTYPPLVHAYCQQEEDLSASSEDPLSVCINIIRMFYSRTKQNTPYIWRSIRFEQTRLFNQSCTFDKQGLLSSAQSILLYILLRSIDTPSEENNFEKELIFTLQRIFGYLYAVRPYFGSVLKRETVKPSWEDWVWAESTNRVVLVYYLLHFFLEIDDSCPDYEVQAAAAPAPCKKILWEAPNSHIWNFEYDLEITEGRSQEQVNCGSIVDLHRQRKRDESVQPALDALYTDVDGLGHLVLLSAALI